MTYSTYFQNAGGIKGQVNPFIMTKLEFAKFQAGQETIEQKHYRLEQRLVDCQNAWHNAMINGLTVDAEHAKVNEKNAFKALVSFEEANGIQ